MTDNDKKTNRNITSQSDNQIDSTLQQHLQQLLTDLQLDDAPAGGSVVVYQAGRCIAQASVGAARLDTSWQPDTLAINFSTGKGVLATLVHVLVSQQVLDYDTPVANYWSAFAAQGKGNITLRQVMSHQANLFSIQSIDVDSEGLLDWTLMLSKIAAMPITVPEDAESYDSAYSALIYGWVLGGVIEAATDMSLAKALRHYLTEPLGIDDSCYFGVPDSNVEQVAKLVKDFEVANEDGSPLRNKRHKPTLKADSQNTLHTYASLPSYPCWQQRVDQQPLTTPSAKNNSHYQSQSDFNNDNDTDTGIQNEVESDEYKPVTLNTAQINSLYFNASSLNLKNYKAALVPANKKPIDYHRRESLQAIIPAANGVASAQALATMYAMLANGGEWQGQVLIDSETFEQLSSPQLMGADAVMPAHMNWRLGYHRLFSVCADASLGFGHMGYNGSVAWCDPTRQLSFAFVHNFDATMLNDVRQFALTEAVLDFITTNDSGYQ